VILLFGIELLMGLVSIFGKFCCIEIRRLFCEFGIFICLGECCGNSEFGDEFGNLVKV